MASVPSTTPFTLDDAVDLALAGIRRVAVVGLSDDPSRASNGVARALLERGVEIVPVNPTSEEVLGLRSYPDLASVPGRVDVVDVFRRPEHLAGVAREAVARDDVGAVWVQLGLRSDEARAVTTAAGRAYVENRCLKVEAQLRNAHAPADPRLEASALLVDLDGTVLDYDAAAARALADTLADLDMDAEAVTPAYRRHNAEHWARLEAGELSPGEVRVGRWSAFLTEHGSAADPVTTSQAYVERLARGGDLLPGAAQALWWLGRRMPLVVLTNGFEDVQTARLAAAGVDGLFRAVVTSDAVGVSKPDPAIVEAALAHLDDHERADVAVVGDQLASDVAAAAAAGLRSVWIAPDHAVVPDGAPPPDQRVARLADVV